MTDKATRDLLDSVADAASALDKREIKLDNRLEAVEEKLRTDQTETIRERGLPADLVTTEQNALRRMSPFRNRWPEVAKFDERAAALEMRQGAVANELRELHERTQAAPAADAEALADWELQGRDGARPESSLPSIKSDIKRLQEEWEGLTRAVTRVLAEKSEYVAKHRRRLVKEAETYTNSALERYVQAINELETAREDLAAHRRASVWATLFPSELASQQPPDSLAGARKRALVPLGVSAPVAPGRVFEALRADASYLAEACTPEQRLAIEGRDPRQPLNTGWANDPAEKAARDQQVSEWLTSR